MKPTSSTLTLWDRLGIGASALCLIHCLAMPFLFTGLAVWATSEAAHTLIHFGVALVAVPLAMASAWPSYKQHRKVEVLLWLAGGSLLILLPVLLHDVMGHDAHVGMTVLGSIALIVGHVRNWQSRTMCSLHTLPHHADHCTSGHSHA